jgi:hypothetical protein
MLLKMAKRELQKWLFNRKEALFTPCHRSSGPCVACMRQLLLAVRPYWPKRRDGLTTCLFSPLGRGPASFDPRLGAFNKHSIGIEISSATFHLFTVPLPLSQSTANGSRCIVNSSAWRRRRIPIGLKSGKNGRRKSNTCAMIEHYDMRNIAE